MKLESARSLKTEALQAVLSRLSAPSFRDRLGISAQSVSRALQPRSLAIGIHHKTNTDYRLAVRVQRPDLVDDRSLIDEIAKSAQGEVDLRYIGRITKHATGQVRPLVPGCSVSHVSVTAGTLAAFVRDRGAANSPPLLLSNNHVLANENRATLGDSIVQPGTLDGGRPPADTVATLTRFIPLDAMAPNNADCAVAALSPAIDTDLVIGGIGRVQSTAVVAGGETVMKVGRTSGLTTGHVVAFELDNVVAGFEMGSLRFDGQIEIEGDNGQPFTRGGDSGALVVSGGSAVALHFAGSESGGPNGVGLSYVSPIETVLNALGVELM